MTESDEALVKRAQTDRAAFGELYQRYAARIYNYIYYRTYSSTDAEDLTEKVFFQALNHLPSYRWRGVPFGAWLLTIAHNVVANWHRDRARHKTVPLNGDVHFENESAFPTESAEELIQVRRAIASLSPERQHLILLKFGEGMSNAEIGRIMGRSEGAIKGLLHRVLKSLRQTLEPKGNE
ncbi:MAG: sigma-70 family RNA polymerase sigma factor [Chloroflexi bacterium]|nr:sigma-70 family RNA polymerase sigma factor [Chloroflexota bacterium]